MNLFHYTDKDGWNAIRSQPDWTFKAHQPPAPERPEGAYFTDEEPAQFNLRLLSRKLGIPKVKLEYVFWFTGSEGLVQLNAGRGRDRHIYYSPVDYVVEAARQRAAGRTEVIQQEHIP